MVFFMQAVVRHTHTHTHAHVHVFILATLMVNMVFFMQAVVRHTHTHTHTQLCQFYTHMHANTGAPVSSSDACSPTQGPMQTIHIHIHCERYRG